MIDPLDQKIVCVATGAGTTHDFALFKSSRLTPLPQIVLLGDTGYQGVDTLHPNSWTPFKKSKLHPLTPEQKQQNRTLASCRVIVENVIRTLKRFRILSSTYRAALTETAENDSACASTSSQPSPTYTNDLCKRSTV